MPEFLNQLLLDPQPFVPHGFCLRWDPVLVGTLIAANIGIAIAYFSIPAALVYFVRKRGGDLPYRWMFLMFAAFIIACGLTHVMFVMTLYKPVYWIEAAVDSWTALISLATAALLWPLIPRALNLRSPEALAALNEQTERQRKLLQTILDTMSDGVIVANDASKLVLFNHAAEKLLGAGPAEVPPERWSEHYGLFRPDQETLYPAEQLPLAQALAGKIADDVEMFIRAPGHSQGRSVSATSRPLSGQDSAFIGGMVVFRDITQRSEAEKRVSEFYSTVSHELRTPLASIRGSLGLIDGGLAGPITDRTRELIKISLVESERLIRLINDILDLRRIEAGKIEFKMAAVETEGLIYRALDNMHGLAHDAGIRLTPVLNTHGKTLCDEDQVIQVLMNLVSNAIKFSTRDAEIRVSLDKGADDAFRFSVVDNGPGIPQDQMHKLFGKFQQLDQSDTRARGGSGLGLAISKAIVERHGGRIGVDSEVASGSVFWFELPAAPVAQRQA